MEIKWIKVHNFRSYRDVEFHLDNYSIIVGANNSGKTTFLTALRALYDDKVKFAESDVPFEEGDGESWIDATYKLSEDEFNALAEKYQQADHTFKIRKYLRSSENKVKKNQSNIYGYEFNELSNNQFYGARNVSEAKIGDIIYIPELSTVQDELKFSGPSLLRDAVSDLFSDLLERSNALDELSDAFDDFNATLRKTKNRDDTGLLELVDSINNDIKEFGITFDLNFLSLLPSELIKYTFKHTLRDAISKKELDISAVGQGALRRLIFSIIKASSQSKAKRNKENSEDGFSPHLKLLLFDEPEAFLHPHQQQILRDGLIEMSLSGEFQVIITNHSPYFLSKNIDLLPGLIRLEKDGLSTKVYQITRCELDDLLSHNGGYRTFLQNKCSETKDKVLLEIINNELTKTDWDLEEEFLWYTLLLDSDSCAAFYDSHVILCEGPSDRAVIKKILSGTEFRQDRNNLQVISTNGKFNIHRYMGLFDKFGISHSAIYDDDEPKQRQSLFNEFLNTAKTPHSKNLVPLPKNLESFLGVSPPKKDSLKPVSILKQLGNGKIIPSKIEDFKGLVRKLL